METFVTADTHFNHANIIKYCHRPFATIEEMNAALVYNWNQVVKPEDLVYFLGDLCFKGSRHIWLSQLNGHKVMIRGNHDKHGLMEAKIEYAGEKFILSHEPIPVANRGKDIWNIHGHHHDTGRVVNPEKKLMCVSIELTNYRPITIDSLLSLRSLYIEPDSAWFGRMADLVRRDYGHE